ncbi:FusB/FusC family EF-G-binding protein [Paenibacillus sp. NFR01]|uniref:FusB/FusC family EF-G-binding protein n=1 Tax=Paenibacillus sp. NFR01 TaxID=1566279 RepID=UPI0008D3BD4B|nr:FusB/FusC family EF-G-binding protein [Paenibacillus sp. NFR01]SET27748.1 FBP C-terminal treble-clef zinc-finger [Paenibacillus sp. NFR01]
MSTSFIRNHQFNVIKKQSDFLLKTLRSVADQKVLKTVRFRTAVNIVEAFTHLTADQQRMLETVSDLTKAEDFQKYLDNLSPYREPFPDITPKQIEKLFPKNKKLKLPDLQAIDFRQITYLSWTDIATGKLYIVYPFEGQFVGIEGRILPTHKKGYCLFCNRQQELAFFTVKTKPTVASQDNFSSIGQYICIYNHACNQSITSTEALEKYIVTIRK